MIKAIIFDYDGVIVDSFPTVYTVYKAICRELGVACPSTIEEFKKLYGYSYKELLKNLGISEDKSEQVQQIFSREIIKQNPPLFEGIADVIAALSKNYRLYLVTSNFRAEALQKMERFGLQRFFYHLAGVGDEPGTRLKKSEEITAIFERDQLSPDEVIYIGDRNIDYDVATKVGIRRIILVDYGWGFDREYSKNIQSMSVTSPDEIRIAMDEVIKHF